MYRAMQKALSFSCVAHLYFQKYVEQKYYRKYRIRLITGIHGKRFHQQGIVKALVAKYFMWIIWQHRFAKL